MSRGLQAARSALAGRSAWLVGGAIRDRLLGRDPVDLDVVVEGDPEPAARAVARAAGGAACFELSHEFGAWRVVARDGSWQLDVEQLRGGSLEADLALRDFTVNAIAEPLAGGDAIDPLGGRRDLAEKRLRLAGEGAFGDDPLRVLRLARAAVELGMEPDADALASARANAAGLRNVSAERVFAELQRVIASSSPRRGLELMSDVGATEVVLPELEGMRGIEQNRYHHLDVHGHTLEVLDRVVDLTAAIPAFDVAAHRAAVAPTDPHSGGAAAPQPELPDAIAGYWPQLAAVLSEPLADGVTRAQGLRWGALLHDAAKPLTRGEWEGRVTFMGHDSRGAELARDVLGRLRASERLRAHVAALARHHLRLGFLVHEPQPLAPRTMFAYMRACEPVEVDVTLLSIADRLATRGVRSEDAIAAHLHAGAQVLCAALQWHAQGPPPPLVRGDELAQEVGIEPGPRLGELLLALSEAQYAGELHDREQAIVLARSLVGTS
jgi:putative nucleotidyltransferase with HDIG domain